MTVLQNRLALHRFVCHEFGYLGGMTDMLDSSSTVSTEVQKPISRKIMKL